MRERGYGVKSQFLLKEEASSPVKKGLNITTWKNLIAASHRVPESYLSNLSKKIDWLVADKSTKEEVLGGPRQSLLLWTLSRQTDRQKI